MAEHSTEGKAHRPDEDANVYNEHFGLKMRPFAIQPDPAFMYWSPLHTRGLTMLEYGLLTRAPITLITGEVGAGKTTILHHLLKSLPENIRLGLVSNAIGDRGDLLRWVLLSLDQPAPPEASYVELFDQFQRYLIDEYAAGNRVAIIIDEAQNLSRDSLEELRMFTNINSNKDELLQLILVGQPELRDLIRSPDLKQFAQRVSSAFHLGPLGASDILPYIQHRMRVAGCPRDTVFSSEAAAIIYQMTGGIPRLVNQLCDLALVYAFADDVEQVSPLTLRNIQTDGVFFAGEHVEFPDNIVPVRPAMAHKSVAYRNGTADE